MRRRILVSVGLCALVAIIAVTTILATGSFRAAAHGDGQASGPNHAQHIVTKYLGILDSGMSTSQCDFSQMSAIYAPDATVTVSGGPFSPGGPFGAGNAFGAQQFHGIQAIIGFYTKTCHVLYSKNAGAPSWTQDAGFLLSPNVLNSYEHVTLGGHFTGRCMHVFTVSGDRITRLDWSVYA